MTKIKEWFQNIKNIFNKKFAKQIKMIDSPKDEKAENQNINIINNLKNYNKANRTTEEIIHIIENNPVMLKSLNVKKLEVIEQYYRDKIVQTEKNIEKVKNDIKELESYIGVLDEKIEQKRLISSVS